ncbi:hypothetical protein BJX68DRAFT_259728 [Aspergillus pseudodeflectus]|uniref:Uncharacterized protein n=1 Tax=Aspergillus pseudodeflectus TaxID=176178 RepID=A0ABR4JAG8_9EURO
MNSLPASSGPRTSNNQVRIQEPPAAAATQLTRPRRRHSMTQPPPQPISHSQAADDFTKTLENHSVCLKTVKDLEGDLHLVEQAVHGAQEALNTCHQQLISCMANMANTGVPSTTLLGSTAGPDSMWASQDEELGVLNPQMFFDV